MGKRPIELQGGHQMSEELTKNLINAAWQILAESKDFDGSWNELEYGFAISQETRHKIRLGDFTEDDIPKLIKEIVLYEAGIDTQFAKYKKGNSK